MNECGRCPERRRDPSVLCALMLSDRHCAASLDTPPATPGETPDEWFTYEDGLMVPFVPQHNVWPPRVIYRRLTSYSFGNGSPTPEQ